MEEQRQAKRRNNPFQGMAIVLKSKANGLYAVRKKLGVSLEYVALLLEMSTGRYYKKEAGLIDMTVDEYEKISSYLKTIKLQRIFGKNYKEKQS